MQITGVTKDGYTMPAIGGISAVVVNLTAVATSAKGFFTLYPNGTTLPTASTINFPAGWTGANMATVPVGADGAIKVFNSGGPADILVDVLGWYAKDDTVRAAYGMGAQFLPATDSGDPLRIYNSLKDPDNGNLPFLNGDWHRLHGHLGHRGRCVGHPGLCGHDHRLPGTASGYFTAWSGGRRPTAGQRLERQLPQGASPRPTWRSSRPATTTRAGPPGSGSRTSERARCT